MKNFSQDMSPKGKTSLFVEYFVFENDKIWNMKNDKLFDLTIKHLEKLGFLKKNEVINYHILKNKFVYPIYDLDYQKNLDIISEYLNKFKNLFWIGRPGRFKYNNQDHSLEMGIEAARSIISKNKIDIDKIGSEKEYFEEGEINIKENPIENKSYNWMILEDRGQGKNKK